MLLCTDIKIIMETIVHRSTGRGYNDNGWLKANYTFCYANYYDPRRINFGALRVLNDNTIAPGQGFKFRHLDNMECVIIPLKGGLGHLDNLENHTIVRQGEAEIISAGTGIIHKDFNQSTETEADYIVLWIFPQEYELPPAYSKVTLNTHPENGLIPIADPTGSEHILKINQLSWIFFGEIEAKQMLRYKLRCENNGVYIVVLEGKSTIEDTSLNRRDAIGVTGSDIIDIIAETDLRVLIIEIPMKK